MFAQDDAAGVRSDYAEHCVMRWSLDYLLRALHETAVTFEGDLLSGIVFLALIRANTQHLGEAVEMSYSKTRGVIADDARRPASAKSISDSLNLPYETVRRRLRALCEQGLCVRQGKGYIAPEAVLTRPRFNDVLSRNYANVQMFLGRIERSGVELKPT